LRILLVFLLLVFFALQYRLWVGEGSYAEVVHLRNEIVLKKQDLNRMQQENRQLRAEIDDLKSGLAAIEERARNDLGMIKENEVYFQIVDSVSEEP
jgi:cell division protein FtsB